MRLTRLLGLSVWRSTLEQWTWRSFLLTLVLDQALAPVIGFLIWTAVAPTSPEIARYYLALLIVQLATVSYEDHTLAAAIFTGDLVDELLRPQPVLIPFLGTNLALRVWHIAIGVPIALLLGAFTATAPALTDVAAAIPSLVVAGVLRFALTGVIALTAFWTEQARNLVGLANTVAALTGGLAAPVFLLPEPWSGIARMLPFWPALGLPAEIASGTATAHDIQTGSVAQLVWLGVAVSVGVVAWRRGLRRYSAIGA